MGASASEVTVRYRNGPVLQITDDDGAVNLACFKTEYRGYHDEYRDIMMDSPAIVSGQYGHGLVVLVSPHVEDGIDEKSRAPFRNIFRLCHCMYLGRDTSAFVDPPPSHSFEPDLC